MEMKLKGRKRVADIWFDLGFGDFDDAISRRISKEITEMLRKDPPWIQFGGIDLNLSLPFREDMWWAVSLVEVLKDAAADWSSQDRLRLASDLRKWAEEIEAMSDRQD